MHSDLAQRFSHAGFGRARTRARGCLKFPSDPGDKTARRQLCSDRFCGDSPLQRTSITAQSHQFRHCFTCNTKCRLGHHLHSGMVRWSPTRKQHLGCGEGGASNPHAPVLTNPVAGPSSSPKCSSCLGLSCAEQCTCPGTPVQQRRLWPYRSRSRSS